MITLGVLANLTRLIIRKVEIPILLNHLGAWIWVMDRFRDLYYLCPNSLQMLHRDEPPDFDYVSLLLPLSEFLP